MSSVERDGVHRPCTVLFLCTGNSARSILAEALLNHWGGERFRGLSAGSHPKGAVHPLALALLAERGLPSGGLRSKSWDEFAQPGAAPIDVVLTVCDAAAGETCPYWPGQPVTAHWGIPDPAAVDGPEDRRRQAFSDAFDTLEQRIRLLTGLPIETLSASALQHRLRAIAGTSVAKR